MKTNIVTILTSNFPYSARVKLRDTYQVGDKLLMVATDRISAFDVGFPNGDT